jgi:hypothetical protein
MKVWNVRIVTLGVSGGRSLTRRYATPAGSPPHDDTGGYAYGVGVWDLSIISRTISVAPCQT